MERILTFAEFSKSFDTKGEVLGNSEKDVAALASVTDEFTAPDNEGGCADSGGSSLKSTPPIQDDNDIVTIKVDGGQDGDSDQEGSDEPGEESDKIDDGTPDEQEKEEQDEFPAA